MNTNFPLNKSIVNSLIKNSGILDIGNASIREIVRLVNKIEDTTKTKFIRMEMGIPGLKAPRIGVEAEIKALRNDIASHYGPIEGIPELKSEVSRFLKLFLKIDVNQEGCIPTVGSMQASFAAFSVANRTNINKEGTLFLDPGFPVHKQQVKVLGHKYKSFDVYDYRGEKLRTKLEEYLKTGKISSILYSNPNNPTWICFTEQELKIIGELATKYDVIVIEDLAYITMDFRKDYSKPGIPPYQPTVANYTDNYVLLISSSKAFSYAGQRIGTIVISNYLFNRVYPDLKRYYTNDKFGYSIIYGAIYALSAGASHSSQYAIAAIYKAANDGTFNFVDDIKEYGARAKVIKKIFIDNDFSIVYDKDENKPIADGFYFTITFKKMTGKELLTELLCYGISAITLKVTGSTHEGLRACVSQISSEKYSDLKYRLNCFKENHR